MKLRDFINEQLPEPIDGPMAWAGVVNAGRPLELPLVESEVLAVMATTGSPVIYQLCEYWLRREQG